MNPEMLARAVERLRALADENRTRLLMRLQISESNVGTLAQELGMGQASVSKHLNVLRQVGLVQVRRQGAQSIYGVRDQSVFELCDLICDGVRRHIQQEHAALGLDTSES